MLNTTVMKPFLLIIFLLMTCVLQSQTNPLPSWALDAFRQKVLDKKYVIASFLKPSYWQADFNGDNNHDIAVLITEKQTKKKGLLLIHNITNEYFILGAGTKFGNGGDDFKWADQWSIYSKKIANETQFDSKTGDIIGGKKVKLSRPGILVEDYEDGAALAGAIIYWDGRKYIEIHQGE
jgi:hypothetical protein